MRRLFATLLKRRFLFSVCAVSVLATCYVALHRRTEVAAAKPSRPNNLTEAKTAIQAQFSDVGRAANVVNVADETAVESAETGELLYNRAMRLLRSGEKGETSEARRLLEQAVERGYPTAAIQLGRLAEAGDSNSGSGEEALKWYLAAAQSGESDGFAEAARLYIEGRVIPADLGLAEILLQQGIGSGSQKAKFLKAVTLLDSPGSASEGLRYLSEAVAAEQPDAIRLLARLYKEGMHVNADPGKAAEYAALALQLGAGGAGYDLADLLLRKDPTSGSDGNSNVAKGVDHMLDAAKSGSANAALTLALLGIGKDEQSAARLNVARSWAISSYERGEPTSAFAVAATYIAAGQSAEAESWLQKGTAANDWRSSYALMLLQQGKRSDEVLKIVSDSGLADYQAYSSRLSNANSTSVTKAPVAVKMQMPRFPTALSTLQTKGAVVAEFVVDPRGRPQSIQILSASHSSLAVAASEAIANWRYEPATRNGKPIAARVRVPIHFASTQ